MIEWISSWLLVQPALAHCPLCTAAAGTGLAVTRFYGLDDAAVGLWLGAFAVSGASWMSRILKVGKEIVAAASVILTLLTLWVAGVLGNPAYSVFGVDRIVLGLIAGSLLAFYVPMMKKRIPYQSLVVTVSILIAATVVLWLI